MSYINQDDLKIFGFNLDSIDSFLVNAFCQTASDIADSYCKQSLALKEDTEVCNPVLRTEGFKIFPMYTPIQSISSIKGYIGTESYVEFDKFYISSDKTYIQVIGSKASSLTYVEFIYNHGYETIPGDLKFAVGLIAASLINDYQSQKDTGFTNIIRQKDGLREIEVSAVDSNIKHINSTAKTILDSPKYKKVR